MKEALLGEILLVFVPKSDDLLVNRCLPDRYGNLDLSLAPVISTRLLNTYESNHIKQAIQKPIVLWGRAASGNPE